MKSTTGAAHPLFVKVVFLWEKNDFPDFGVIHFAYFGFPSREDLFADEWDLHVHCLDNII